MDLKQGSKSLSCSSLEKSQTWMHSQPQPAGGVPPAQATVNRKYVAWVVCVCLWHVCVFWYNDKHLYIRIWNISFPCLVGAPNILSFLICVLFQHKFITFTLEISWKWNIVVSFGNICVSFLQCVFLQKGFITFALKKHVGNEPFFGETYVVHWVLFQLIYITLHFQYLVFWPHMLYIFFGFPKRTGNQKHNSKYIYLYIYLSYIYIEIYL